MTVVSRGQKQPMEPKRDDAGSLVHVVETLLDKGLVLNADIMVSVAGVELLGIRLRAALASFETAAKYGLEFPAGTDTSTAAWQNAIEPRESCPSCGKRSPVEQLLNDHCPWCGWRSAQAIRMQDGQEQAHLPAGRGGDAHGSEDVQETPEARQAADPAPGRRRSRTDG